MRWLKEMLEGGFELKTGKKLLCPQSSWSTFSNVAAEFSFFLGISDFHLENLVFEAAWPQPCNWRSSVRSALFSPSGAWQICAQTSTFCSQKAAPGSFWGADSWKDPKKVEGVGPHNCLIKVYAGSFPRKNSRERKFDWHVSITVATWGNLNFTTKFWRTS